MTEEARRIKETYAKAGVDISLAAKTKELIGKHARSTLRPEVLSGVGFFGGLFEFKGYEEPVLVSSVDGVGTKLKIASALAKHDTIGIDIVNHRGQRCGLPRPRRADDQDKSTWAMKQVDDGGLRQSKLFKGKYPVGDKT